MRTSNHLQRWEVKKIERIARRLFNGTLRMNVREAREGVTQGQMVEFMKKHAKEFKKRFNQGPPKKLMNRMERTGKEMMKLQEKMNE